MEKIEIEKWKLKKIENALRLAINALGSRHNKNTATDRALLRADEIIKEVLKPESDLFDTPIKYSSKMKEWPIMNVIKTESDGKQNSG